MHVRVAEPEKMERRATSPIRYVVAYDNSKYHHPTEMSYLIKSGYSQQLLLSIW